MDNKVFISYRREASEYLARAVYQDLDGNGIDVFMDVESINAGQFNKIIMSQIATRPYFLLLLTPGTLERCTEPKDWLRLEIEQAIILKRQIVILRTPKFDFNEIDKFFETKLADELKLFNSINVPHDFFAEAMDRLRSRFLVPIELNPLKPLVDTSSIEQSSVQTTVELKVTDEQLSAQEYFERAMARAKEDLDGKIADYNEAVRLNPQFTEAYNSRGIAFADKQLWEDAIADFNKVIYLNPQHAYAYSNRGNARTEKGDFEGAITDYIEALHINPEYTDIYCNLGCVFFNKSDLGRSIMHPD